jgi:hypothetical protein
VSHSFCDPAVADHDSIAFAPRMCLEDELARGELVAVRIKEMRIQRELRLVYRRHATLSAAAQAFLLTAREMATAQGVNARESGVESRKSGIFDFGFVILDFGSGHSERRALFARSEESAVPARTQSNCRPFAALRVTAWGTQGDKVGVPVILSGGRFLPEAKNLQFFFSQTFRSGVTAAITPRTAGLRRY